MNQKSYNSITGFVFLVVTIVHLLRVLNGWDISIHTFDMPIWVSWIGVLLAGYLTSQGLRKRS